MDIMRHLGYCPAGTPYFDLPATAAAHEDDFPATSQDLPEGWTRAPGAEWVVMTPPNAGLPRQGWKIHVSATLGNAGHILDVVHRYCVAEGVMFKYLRGPGVLKRRNSKYGDRSASGKFVTVYPVDDGHLARVLDELGGLLEGQEGPYILSDLRWRGGPLYVRYGGFVLQAVRAENGELVYCIEDPQGELVPDRRGPGFRPPEWVTLPDCLAEAVAARDSGTLGDFPYRVTSALHFSNGGGVYRGVDTRTGADVLLREARPHAGLDADGRDAVARHRQEHWALDRLQGLPCVPELLDYRKGHEHYFLVRAYVEGRALSKELLDRNPLLRGRDSAAEPEVFAAYTDWALRVLARIEEGVRGLHDRGVVFGDLHPGNILIGPGDDGAEVTFIDFETASDAADEAVQHMGAVGFMAPAGYMGRAVDRYALGCLRLALFAPLAAAVPWTPGRAQELLDMIAGHFPVPAGFAGRVRADLGLDDPGRPVWTAPRAGDWPALRAELVQGVLAGASPERTDRLFPGDAEQFFTPLGGAGFAYGAAGVLWALDRAGATAGAGHLDWLAERARTARDPAPGFFRGLAGIAYALDGLGRPADASDLLDRITDADLDRLDDSLYDGLAGVGLTRLHLARGDAGRLPGVLDIAARLTDRPADRERPPLGLVRGPSGAALFLLRLYERTGQPELLDGAEQRLRADLRRLGWDGTGFPPDSAGRLPLVASGSGGTGLVLHDLLRHRPDPGLTRARDAIRDATSLPFCSQAGLFHGRAGVLQVHLRLTDGRPDAAVLRAHLDGLALHAVHDRGRLAFLGQQCLRISADLATGTAGVLLALHAALTGRRGMLPFF
ncbi:class III lanthionine synthetase LanKC [Streptomyces sp. NPDC047017]|uniref:class III lanthionine synthetase LanKC n=1 Tax=Streptomyces sp. NPDC047017 TaxID=3155024 RepID=UPI0033EAD835